MVEESGTARDGGVRHGSWWRSQARLVMEESGTAHLGRPAYLIVPARRRPVRLRSAVVHVSSLAEPLCRPYRPGPILRRQFKMLSCPGGWLAPGGSQHYYKWVTSVRVLCQRDGDYADQHTPEESARIMTRRRGRATRQRITSRRSGPRADNRSSELAVIYPDFPLDLTGFFSGKH